MASLASSYIISWQIAFKSLSVQWQRQQRGDCSWQEDNKIISEYRTKKRFGRTGELYFKSCTSIEGRIQFMTKQIMGIKNVNIRKIILKSVPWCAINLKHTQGNKKREKRRQKELIKMICDSNAFSACWLRTESSISSSGICRRNPCL